MGASRCLAVRLDALRDYLGPSSSRNRFTDSIVPSRSSSSSACPTHGTISVSYTHLDVYKRQECIRVLRYINQKLAKWARKKYKPLRKRDRQSEHYLGRLARRRPDLLALWALGVKPPVEKART